MLTRPIDFFGEKVNNIKSIQTHVAALEEYFNALSTLSQVTPLGIRTRSEGSFCLAVAQWGYAIGLKVFFVRQLSAGK